MKIRVVSALTASDLFEEIGSDPIEFASVHSNSDIDLESFFKPKNVRNLHGATSCNGSMTNSGIKNGFSAFLISDPDGAYGTALSCAANGMKNAASSATRQALINADRIGELPEMIWISATPGSEEEAIAGIEDVVGGAVPIIGGSAADNTVEGNWSVFDGSKAHGEGIVVSVLFPSSPVSFAYQNGYSPTSRTGKVTEASGRRILSIDNQPATKVYEEWTSGSIPSDLGKESSKPILSQSTMWPFGRPMASLGDVPFYLLAHPAVSHANGSIDLFANVEIGEEITLMTGTKKSLIERAGRVAALARKNRPSPNQSISGALMIYCGGCMLSVQNELNEVVNQVDDALDGAPFLGAFTFGEQGTLIKGGNRHGNLMISCIIFG